MGRSDGWLLGGGGIVSEIGPEAFLGCYGDGWTDRQTDEIRKETPWKIFADYTIICWESREQVEENLER